MLLFFLDSWILKGEGTVIRHGMYLRSDTVSNSRRLKSLETIIVHSEYLLRHEYTHDKILNY
jgi:hypothetical protein